VSDWSSDVCSSDLAGLFTEHLPRNDIGVVFHRRDDDLVSLLEKSSPITLRNQVYRLRSAANEDNFPFAPGVNKALDFLARRFIGCGRPFAQIVDAPMNIRILRAVVATQCVDDTLRLLAGSA